jgi:sugar lactone lactonase YvrE
LPARFLIPLLAPFLCCAQPLRADTLFVSYSNTADTIEMYATGGISGENTDEGAFTTTNVDTPNGVAFDSQGNLYVANTVGNSITEFETDGTVITFATGLSAPSGLAFDQYGTLYVANYGSTGPDAESIVQITPGGTASIFASGLNGPNGLAFGSNGNLYVANEDNDSIDEVTPGGQVSLFASASGPDGVGFSALNQPLGLAFDSSGNLYVANWGTSVSNIEEFSPAGVPTTFATSGLANPYGIAFDSSGDLYVTNYSHTGGEGNGYSTIEEFSSSGSLLDTFNDNNMDLRDGAFIALENNDGVPVLDPIPEPSTCALFVLGAASFLGLSRLRRRRAVAMA